MSASNISVAALVSLYIKGKAFKTFSFPPSHIKQSSWIPARFCVRTFTVHLCVPLPIRDLEQLSISIKMIFGDLH